MYLKRLKFLSIKLSVDNLGWTNHELITLSPPATNPQKETKNLVDWSLEVEHSQQLWNLLQMTM